MTDNAKGFRVEDGGIQEHEMAKGASVTEMLHTALDVLLKEISTNNLAGCKVVVQARPACEHPEHEQKQFTLSLFESTGQKDCVWCDGTGVDGS